MRQHALSGLEAELRRAAQPKPPTIDDWKGTKWNKQRRESALWSALRDWHQEHRETRPFGRGVNQEQLDRRALGNFHGWIVASRAELAAVERIGKAQASMKAAKYRVSTQRRVSSKPPISQASA